MGLGSEHRQRALTLKRTLGVRFEVEGALELRYLGLLKDSGERGEAPVSNLVEPETVGKGWCGDDEKAGVHEPAGADTKANTQEVVRVPKQPT